MSLNRVFATMFLMSIVVLGAALQFMEVESIRDLVISKTATADLANSPFVVYLSPQFFVLLCFNTF